MMITEHNCEKYFLLYTDNELSAAERKAVEDFVSEYPDYLPLFTALQETKMPADDEFFFSNKESLYKDEASDIGINNYEDYFLLYTDNELSDKQRETTERFVLQHPQYQEEFILLQQTKLPPEIVEFKNKEKLYRKERRVLPLYFGGLAAAAAFFAVLFFSGLFVSPSKNGNRIASTSVHPDKNVVLQPAHKPEAQNDVISQPAGERNGLLHNKETTVETEKTKSAIKSEKNIGTHAAPAVQTTLQPHEDIVAVQHPAETQVLQTVSAGSKPIAGQENTLRPLVDVQEEPAMATETMSLTDNNIARTAVYKELDTDDDNQSVYVSGVQLNKNKVNGFLKSASRLLGGKTRQTEE